MSRYDISEFEWRVVAPLLPNKLRGVPSVDDRHVLNGIFSTLRSDSPWAGYARALRPAHDLLQSLQLLYEGGRLGSDHGYKYSGLRRRRADDRRDERPRSSSLAF